MSKPTTAQLIQTFKQYFVSWLNIIMTERGIYPTTSFETRNSFNLRVPHSRHPGVQQWQNGLIDDLLNDLTFKHLMAIRVIIYSGDNIECYTIDVKDFLTIQSDYHDKPINISLVQVVDQYRANLNSFISEIRTLQPSTKHPKWDVVVETKGLTMNEDWILDHNRDNECIDMDSVTALPIVDVGPIVFYSSIEVK